MTPLNKILFYGIHHIAEFLHPVNRFLTDMGIGSLYEREGGMGHPISAFTGSDSLFTQ